MTDLTTLRALEARLVAATGPDREIDGALFLLAEGFAVEWRGNDLVCIDERGIAQVFGTADPGKYQRRKYQRKFLLFSPWDRGAPHYTASIDAAVALIERLLPGWSWSASRNGWALLYGPQGERVIGNYVDLPVAMRLCLALCRALLTNAEQNLQNAEQNTPAETSQAADFTEQTDANSAGSTPAAPTAETST